MDLWVEETCGGVRGWSPDNGAMGRELGMSAQYLHFPSWKGKISVTAVAFDT